jgi:hypothetical protein
MRSTLIAMVLCGASFASAAELKPIETETRFKTCAEVTTITAVKGTCYIYDIQTKEQYVEVYVGAGVNLSAGGILLGGSFEAVLEAVIKFPIGHSEKDLQKAAQKEMTRILKSEELKKKLSKLSNKPAKIESVRKVDLCTDEDDPLACAFRGAVPMHSKY